MYIGETGVALIYGLCGGGGAVLVLLVLLAILLPLLYLLRPKEEEKVKVISKKNYSSFYDNHASCNMYSAETLSIPKDPGDENRVYGYVDLQSDITLQQSLAYQSSKDLCVNTVPNVCYGQLRSTS